MVFGFVGARVAIRWSLRGTLAVGVLVALAGALGLVVAGLAAVPVVVVILSLFALASGVAVTSPPATTLALAEYPGLAGTASSLLGMVRFGLGGVVAPLVGIAGAGTVLPLGVVTAVCVLLAAATSFALRRHHVSASSEPGLQAARA